VKSENIFIDARGDAKIGDLGVAKTLRNTGDLGRTLVGTPFYLSPELCDRRPYDQKSGTYRVEFPKPRRLHVCPYNALTLPFTSSQDVWSLGVVLYEMVTGKPPFRANSQAELFLRILDGKYAPLPKKENNAGGVSCEMRELVSDMLLVNANRRVCTGGILNRVSSRAMANLLGVELPREFRLEETDDTTKTKTTKLVHGIYTADQQARPSTAVPAPVVGFEPSAVSQPGRAVTTEDRRRNALPRQRPSTTRAGLRADAIAEAEEIRLRKELADDVGISGVEVNGVGVNSQAHERQEGPRGYAHGLAYRLNRPLSAAVSAGIAAAAAGGGAAGEAAANCYLKNSPIATRFSEAALRLEREAYARDDLGRAGAATAAQARALRQNQFTQNLDNRRERERAREEERKAHRDANEEASKRQRRKVALAEEASVEARARLAAARGKRVGAINVAGFRSPLAAQRPSSNRRPYSSRQDAMAAAGRCRMVDEAALVVAALPDQFRGEPLFLGCGGGMRQGMLEVAAALKRVDALRARPQTAAAFGAYAHSSPTQSPVRPLWPTRPSTAAAGHAGARASSPHYPLFKPLHAPRPSSAAALRRAEALIQEIEAGEVGDTGVLSPQLPEKTSSCINSLTVDTKTVALFAIRESPSKSGGLVSAGSQNLDAFGGRDTTWFETFRFDKSDLGLLGGKRTIAPGDGDGDDWENENVDGDSGDASASPIPTNAEKNELRETSGDENEIPQHAVTPLGTSVVALKSPHRGTDDSPGLARPRSAFGARSVRSSLDAFKRRQENAGAVCESHETESESRAFAEHLAAGRDADNDVCSTTIDWLVESLIVELEAATEGFGGVDVRADNDDFTSCDEHETDSSCDEHDASRSARVDTIVAEMADVESRGSAFIGTEAFGRLYDALARRAEAAAAAALADASEDDESMSDSDVCSESDDSAGGSWKNSPGHWTCTLGPFETDVTVQMSPKLVGGSSNTRRMKKQNRMSIKFGMAETLALRYAQLVSELTLVGRSRDGSPDGDDKLPGCDAAMVIAAGGPTGR